MEGKKSILLFYYLFILFRNKLLSCAYRDRVTGTGGTQVTLRNEHILPFYTAPLDKFFLSINIVQKFQYS